MSPYLAIGVLLISLLSPALQSEPRPLQALMIEFWIRDHESTLWDGSVTLSGGELVELRGHHFTSEHRIDGHTWTAGSTSWPASPQVMHPREVPFPHATRAMAVGITVYYRAPAAGRLSVSTKEGDFAFRLGDLPGTEPLYFLESRLKVYRVPAVTQITTADYEDDYPSISAGQDGTLSVTWIAYREGADEVWLRQRQGGVWESLRRVTEEPGDLYGTDSAVDAQGRLWVVWSQRDGARWHLKARWFDGPSRGPIEPITSGAGTHLFHRLVADSQGKLHLTWQGATDGRFQIYYRSRSDRSWSPQVQISDPASQKSANDWHPDVAVDSSGAAWVAWDTYDGGSYNVRLRRVREGRAGKVLRVTDTPRFHARPSVAVDARDRVWVAYELAGENWGKDTGFLFKGGTGLYESRDIRVLVYDGSGWLAPRQQVSHSVLPGVRRYLQTPRLLSDAAGRMWMIFRPRTLANRSESDWAAAGKWEVMASFYAGDHWSEATVLPESVGRNGGPFDVAATGSGEVQVAWVTDQRVWGGGDYGPKPGDHQVVVAEMANRLSERAPAAASLGAAGSAPPARLPAEPREEEQVAEMRDYQLVLGGRTYRIYRGDLHRHTDISRDGGGDGSLFDSYRYMLDAAAMDFYLVTDHNSGDNHEYSWWRIEKSEDMFYLPQRFVTLFGYERSLNYPNGHRNIVFAERGHRPLPATREEWENSTGPVLYPYLRETGGIAISHTSHTRMGTDWRDNDPELEPIVEIFQGARTSAEHEGAPLAPSEDREALVAGSYRPLGFVWKAWEKGYKLSVQASSDHVSTHIAYAMVLAEDFTREGLLDAMKQRHTYGATSNILLDFRLRDGSDEYIHGDAFATSNIPLLWVHVVGTNRIKEVAVVRDNLYVYRRDGEGERMEFTFMDADLSAGEHYYYVRVEQVDGHVAWASPIWVDYR